MPFLKDDPTRWLAKSEECRIKAKGMSDSTAKNAMLQVAEAYENLARKAEAAIRAGVKPRDWVSP